MAEERKNPIKVAFVGNPNCGKTTLFNAYTGASLKVANWPGVTVERKEGRASYHGEPLALVDLPGIYSLTSYTMEEKVSRKEILDGKVDVIVNVADASCLERNLYLTLQLLELGKPVILALNMMDIVEERGMEIDLHRMPEMLGNIPVVPVSARKRTGLDVLLHAVVHHYKEIPDGPIVGYAPEIEEKIERLAGLLADGDEENRQILRWRAIKLLEHDQEVMKEYPADISSIADRNYETEIINQKYDYIGEVLEECLLHKSEKAEATDRIDRYLTHPVWGVPIFLGIMACVFFLTFTVGDLLKGGFEAGLDWFSGAVRTGLEAVHASGWMISLIVDGIVAGVGGILTFLPNIFILFLALAFLEDSGYMARVAYVMDGIMGKLGLSGKAFLPMVLGFGCTVPAIMASRALEKESDRKKTILVTPFMSCSARLPVYVLFSEMFFPRYAYLAAFSMYVLGVAIAILVALAASRLTHSRSDESLLIELPEYKTPNARTIRIYVWEKIKDYLTKAGTVIFLASIVLWFVLNFNASGMVENVSDSFGAMLGHWLVPVLEPAGLGMWQIALALICGISAKEVVVSSFSVLYEISNINSAAGMSALAGILGMNHFGALNAASLMAFCLLYVPCIATMATIRRETGSWKWTAGVAAFQLLLAWTVAVLIYQVGGLLGL